MAKKPIADLSSLVATKGAAEPTNMPTRAGIPAPAPISSAEDNSQPLNFRVPGEFRRRFKMFAAANDMKLNELLYRSFEQYEASQKK
ncbi:hypothetical protein ACFIQG_19940 [Comamonas odontotermitis]|uniref:hypothetical protein n=1 Tax=Comamonas odontotermitis TaxID=379895 RepID=UPI00366DE6EA